MRSVLRLLLCLSLGLACRADPDGAWDRVHQQAVERYAAGKPEEASALAEKALRVAESLPDPDSTRIDASRKLLAKSLLKLGKHQDAENHFRILLESRQQALGRDHPELADVQYELGMLEMRSGRLKDAEQHLRACLLAREKQLGPNHAKLANPLLGVSEVLRRRANFDEAAQHAGRLVAVLEGSRGPDDGKTTSAMLMLADLHRKAAHPEKAEPLLTRVVQTLDEQTDAEPDKKFRAWLGLGGVYLDLNEPAKAEEPARRAVGLAESLHGQDHDETWRACEQLAASLHHQEKIPQARAVYLGLTGSMERTRGAHHPGLVPVLMNHARLHTLAGDEEGSIRLVERALRILQDKHGPNAAELGPVLIHLAKLHTTLSNLNTAREITGRILALDTPSDVAGRAGRLVDIQRMAILQEASARPDLAEQLRDEAEDIWDGLVGTDSFGDHARELLLRRFLSHREDPEAVELYYRFALRHAERRRNPTDASVQSLRFGLACNLIKQQRPAAAEAIFRHAVELAETHRGPDHRMTALALDLLADFYAEHDQPEASEAARKRAAAIKEARP